MENYILDGKTPVIEPDLIKWAQWHGKADRHVDKTELPTGELISTVFLGTNHAFILETPVLFETMIFGGEHDEFQERYSTWEEAEIGHKRAIEMIKHPKVI